MFVLYQLGVVAWVAGAWPHPDLSVVRGIGAALLIPSIVGYTACVGLFGRVGPIFGCAVRSPQDGWQRHIYLLNASMVLRALEVPIGLGVWPEAWGYIAWAGPLGVLAMTFFTMNILMTVRRPHSPLLQPTVPVHALQPLAARR